MPNNQEPLTEREYSLLLKALAGIAANINRLLNQGVMVLDESLDDERIRSSQRKIEACRATIRKEQERIKRLRDYLRRKKSLNKHL